MHTHFQPDVRSSNLALHLLDSALELILVAQLRLAVAFIQLQMVQLALQLPLRRELPFLVAHKVRLLAFICPAEQNRCYLRCPGYTKRNVAERTAPR